MTNRGDQLHDTQNNKESKHSIASHIHKIHFFQQRLPETHLLEEKKTLGEGGAT